MPLFSNKFNHSSFYCMNGGRASGPAAQSNHLQGFHLFKLCFPTYSMISVFGPKGAKSTSRHSLSWHCTLRFWFCVRSPLLTESQLMLFPGGTLMFQFPPVCDCKNRLDFLFVAFIIFLTMATTSFFTTSS